MDILSDAPPDLENISFQSIEWHKQQLKDIAYAGIDTILPIYWYDEGNLWWSRPGIAVLAKALEQAREEGYTPPSVGMFLDTTSSTGIDLRLENQKAYLYENIHYFFSTIPRSYWALTEDNRPILWYYTGNWPAAYDQGFIDYIYDHFRADFGARPYMVFESSWDYPAQTQNGQLIKETNAPHLMYDANYNWGGAVRPTSTFQITSIGPGYDDRLIPGRNPPNLTNRRNGDTYRNSFIKAIMCGKPWLALETWNEFHEATDIAESHQYGRQYIEITHEFAAYFKNGRIPDSIHIVSDYLNTSRVGLVLKKYNQETGLFILPSEGDGLHTPITIANVTARQTIPMTENAEASYLYFSVDDGFYFEAPQKITLSVMYLDNGYEPIYIQYDSASCNSLFDVSRIYKPVLLAVRGNTQTWITVSLQIADATFSGNQNGGADFRLTTWHTPLIISEIRIDKKP